MHDHTTTHEPTIVHAQFQHAPLGPTTRSEHHYHARVRLHGSDALTSAFTFDAQHVTIHEHELIGLTINQARALALARGA